MWVVGVWHWIKGSAFVSWVTVSKFRGQKSEAGWGKKQMLMSVLMELRVHSCEPPHPTQRCGVPGPLPSPGSLC